MQSISEFFQIFNSPTPAQVRLIVILAAALIILTIVEIDRKRSEK